MSNKEQMARDITAEVTVNAAIYLGVRVDRVVMIPSDDYYRVTREIFARGGRRVGGDSVYRGADNDGVEWAIALDCSGGLTVIAPATPGAAPTALAKFSRLDDALAYARMQRRPWRRDQDIRIELASGRSVGSAKNRKDK